VSLGDRKWGFREPLQVTAAVTFISGHSEDMWHAAVERSEAAPAKAVRSA
jgi:hypothetical protein